MKVPRYREGCPSFLFRVAILSEELKTYDQIKGLSLEAPEQVGSNDPKVGTKDPTLGTDVTD